VTLASKVALVTGGSSGLGRAIVTALVQAGAAVLFTYRTNADAARALVEELSPEGTVASVQGDVGSEADVARFVAEAVGRLGRLDILVNNAGIIRRNDALDLTEEDWDAVLDLNLKSVFFLSQAAARAMLEGAGRGKIINIASMLSFQGGIRVAAYTASKSAIAGLTRGLANEWAARGINVNAIAPGYFETNNTIALRADAERSADILKRIPAGRWGKPQDLGGAAVFLASSASDYVHGTVLPVDGGWLAR
jgi:2-deoxy-D-gluconate 3-dehydrogenase